jgi:MurNAc alpha-1-phosphate uridylyltransferase
MKAMILAAGYGKRLLPLTASQPKPMLEIAGKPLLQHHIEKLAAAGITDLVINTSWLAKQIEDYFGDGSEFGVTISWSRESVPLETGGGIAKALPLLGEQPFILINGDIWTDFSLSSIKNMTLTKDQLGWLLMVENPSHNPQGDFALVNGLLCCQAKPRFTFTGISLLSAQLFNTFQSADSSAATFPLRDLLRPAIEVQKISGAIHRGDWCDVGTPERYNQLNAALCSLQ